MVDALVWAAVAVCGALGAVGRYKVDAIVSARLAGEFPFGTLAVNLTGSFALGIIAGASAAHDVALILGTGFLGGYTTFSTWMVESVRLGELGAPVLLLRNLWLSLLAGLAFAAAGYVIGQAIA